MLMCPKSNYFDYPKDSIIKDVTTNVLNKNINNNNNNNNNNNTDNVNHNNARAPRIISEIRKSKHFRDLHIRTRISGDLLVLLGTDDHWSPRRAMVKAGQLFLGQVHNNQTGGGNQQKLSLNSALRIPLRQLSLQAGSLPNSFSLVRGQTILITLQTSNEKTLDLWVKTIAIELIRQTPLESVKYLDILSLTTKENWKQSTTTTTTTTLLPKPEEKNHLRLLETPVNFPAYDIDENASVVEPSTTVERLLQKCQNNECYVPVKEKLVLFESLCRMSSYSAEDVSVKEKFAPDKRTRSMHDLSYCFSSGGGGVREICKYFETKFEEKQYSGGTSRRIKRLVNSDSSLLGVPFNRHLENVSYA